MRDIIKINRMVDKIIYLIKFVYKCLPFKKHLFLLIKFFYKPDKKIYQHLYFNGVFKVKVDSNTYFFMKHYGYELENDLFWCGLEQGWEKKSIQLWIRLSRISNIIFDIGANTGLFSLISKSVNPSAQVFAFEPIQKVYQKLLLNNQLNRFNISCHPYAVSDFSGKAKVFLPNNYEHVYSVTVNKNLNRDSKTELITEEIDTIVLYDFITKNCIDKIDLMKIDVETHEYEVLFGMREFLFNMKPTLLIEIIDDQVAEKLNQLFQHSDYLYFDINESTGKIIKKEKLQRSSTFNYLICTSDIAKKLYLIS